MGIVGRVRTGFHTNKCVDTENQNQNRGKGQIVHVCM
jgi:hypothetical protein